MIPEYKSITIINSRIQNKLAKLKQTRLSEPARRAYIMHAALIRYVCCI